MIIFGRKDEHEELGIAILECPTCQQARPFRVYEERKRLTLYLIPTISVDKDMLAACTACGETLEVPEELKADLEKRLMTEEDFRQRLAELPPQAETKICPYCAEEIKAAAIVCRYCQRDLPQ